METLSYVGLLHQNLIDFTNWYNVVDFLAHPPGRGIVSILAPGTACFASLRPRHLANFPLHLTGA
jgi:hypothetical protein